MAMERFLLGLRRMTARRGMCGIIWSDNAKTFKGAKKECEKCCRIVDADQTQVGLSEKKIKWKFLMESAPWWGRFYERLVRTVKTLLTKILPRGMLVIEQ